MDLRTIDCLYYNSLWEVSVVYFAAYDYNLLHWIVMSLTCNELCLIGML
jgi:hypothetical protein